MDPVEITDGGTHIEELLPNLPNPVADAHAASFVPLAVRAVACRKEMDNLKGCVAERNRDGTLDHGDCDAIAYLEKMLGAMIKWGISTENIVPSTKPQLCFKNYLHKQFTRNGCCYGCEPDNWPAGEINDVLGAAEYICWRVQERGVLETGVDTTSRAVVPTMYYVRPTGKYAVAATGGDWQQETEGNVIDRLIRSGVSAVPPGTGMLSEAEEALMNIRDNAPVDVMLALAGYPRGRHEVNGLTILVPKTFHWVQSAYGEERACKHVIGLINGLFAELCGKQWDYTEVEYVLAYLKESRQALQTGNLSGAQATFMCGPSDAGKSVFIDNVVVPLLGGRQGSAYNYITGASSFNDELISSEVWVMDDGPPVGDYAARRRLASLLKQAVASRNVPCHGKGKAQITVPLYRRLFVALNPEDVENLPPLNESMGDKYMLLKTSRCVMPSDCMALPILADRPKFAAQLRSELPHFAGLLDHLEIKQELRDRRFGVKCFKHPELVAAAQEVSDLDTKYGVLCEILFHGREAEAVELPASEIYMRLMRSVDKEMASQLFRNPRSLAMCLTELRASPKFQHLIRSRILHGTLLWTVTQNEVYELEAD